MSEQVIDEGVVRRLQKLLALAKNNDNEHEAQMAMDKAQSMMAELNLTFAEVESHGGKVNAEGKREKSKIVGRALYQYQRELMSAVADANYCVVYLSEVVETQGTRRVKRKSYIIIGRQANVVTTQIMFDYLNETMERLVPIASNKERLSRSAISWKEGCAARLRERIRQRKLELYRESERETNERRAIAKHPASASSGTAVALLDLRDITELEYERNMDLLYGYPEGHHTQKRLERQAAAREAGPPAPYEPKPETAAEKAKREADTARYTRKWERENRAYWARRDLTAYHAGSAAGENIGLDPQIGKAPDSKRIT